MIKYEHIFSLLGVEALLGFALLYVILLMIYRVCFHPLARFPGPKLAAATGWYEFYFDILHGTEYTFMHEIERIHEVHGLSEFATTTPATLFEC